MKNRSPLTRRLSPSLAIATLVLSTGTAVGQVGAGGHALDANLHQYDGRMNISGPRVEDQARLNNALITGNVTGGRSFRGFVGYRATNDFGDHLGSNDLYTFRRDSALSAVSGLNIRPSDALRYQFALSTGQSPPAYVAGGIAVAQRSGASAPVTAAAGSTNAAALRATSDYLTGQSVRPALVGSRLDDQGYEYTAKASPMMGIDWVKSTRPVVRIDRPDRKLAEDDLGSVKTAEPSETPTSGIDERRTIPGATGAETGTRSTPSPIDREAMLNPLRPPALRVEPVSPVHGQVLDAFRDGFAKPDEKDKDLADKKTGKPGESDKAPTDNSLEAQLDRLRNQLRPDTTSSRELATWKSVYDKPKDENAKAKPGTAELGDLLKDGKDDRTRPGTTRPGAKPDAQGKNNKDKTPDPLEGLTANQRLTPELSRALKNTGSIRLDRLSRIESTAKPPPNQPLYDAAMNSAQDMFARKQYFDAEDQYTRALAAISGDPMAQVGRAHAQLSAGLYLSAATNLRTLFADHPELIGVRYADALVPPADRTEAIAKQLREELGRPSSSLGRDAAFLLAYVGHLRSDEKLTRDGLAEMARRYDPQSESDQALIQALRAAWLK